MGMLGRQTPYPWIQGRVLPILKPLFGSPGAASPEVLGTARGVKDSSLDSVI